MEQVKQIKIGSVSSYIKAIFDLRKSRVSEYSRSSYWTFRGQKNSQWSINPNIFRGDALHYEFDSIDKAVRLRPNDFRECSTNFEILTKLQHYGLGTRLLDVTLNPLIALFFASEKYEEFVPGKDKRGKYVPRDGKIVYQYKSAHKLSDLNARIASALPFIEDTQDMTLSKLCEELQKRNIFDSNEISFLENNNYKEFINSIQRNVFVVSTNSNERLDRQNGAFIIPTSINVHSITSNHGNCPVRKAKCDLDDEFEKMCFIIPSEKKEEIRRELDFINVNEATLFPELEHQLIYLQNKHYPNPGIVEEFKKFSENSDGYQESLSQAKDYSHYPVPDIEKIVNKYLSNYPTVSVQVKKVLNDGTSELDWWLKESAVSRMTRDIVHILQAEMSAQDSRFLANNIVKDVLIPGKKDRIGIG